MHSEEPRWVTYPEQDRPNALHIVPVDDWVEHTAYKCVCMPQIEIVVSLGTMPHVMFTHNSLDGRELRERGGDVPPDVVQ